MRFWRDTGGNIAILFAVGFAIAAMVAAVAVDAAALYHERRMIQNGVDLAALAAATDLDNAELLAQQSLLDAGLLRPGQMDGFSVVAGRYIADPSIEPGQRFTPDASPANAARVSFSRPGTLYFAKGWADAPIVGAQGLAANTPQVAFSVGSRLASLNGGIANALLNALLGTSISLSAVDYENLLDARVDMLDLLDALADEVGVNVGTYDDLANITVDHGQIAEALARLVDGAAHSALAKLAQSAGNNGVVRLGDLLDIGPLAQMAIGSGEMADFFADIGVLDLLAASAAIGNGSHQVALGLSAGVPGLVGLETSVAVGEPAQGASWHAVGPVGTMVRTAQIRVRLVASVAGSGALAGAQIRVPLYLEVASAEAKATQASCPSVEHPSGSAVVAVRPGVLKLRLGEVGIGEFGDFGSSPAVAVAKLVEVKLLGLTVLRALAAGAIEIAQTSPVSLAFSSSDIANGTIRSVSTSTPVASLTASLLNTLTVQAPVLGLGLNLNSLTALLKAIILPVTPALDLVLERVLATFGIKIGEADVIVYGVRCSGPVLVG